MHLCSPTDTARPLVLPTIISHGSSPIPEAAVRMDLSTSPRRCSIGSCAKALPAPFAEALSRARDLGPRKNISLRSCTVSVGEWLAMASDQSLRIGLSWPWLVLAAPAVSFDLRSISCGISMPISRMKSGQSTLASMTSARGVGAARQRRKALPTWAGESVFRAIASKLSLPAAAVMPTSDTGPHCRLTPERPAPRRQLARASRYALAEE